MRELTALQVDQARCVMLQRCGKSSFGVARACVAAFMSTLALGCALGSHASPNADASDEPVTGRACQTATDCGDGYACNTEVPGGYCLVGTPGGAMACREPEAPCPSGTVCSPVPWHQISGVCMRPCDAIRPCRESYICNFVQTFPGDPINSRSSVSVCWTACEPGIDQSCNDDPLISSLHGTCESNATCTCQLGAGKNPMTGRCL